MTEHTMRLADNAAGSVQKERPFVDVLQLGYLRDDMIRTVQSFILIGRTLFFSVAEQR
jgi:hypothetical protein